MYKTWGNRNTLSEELLAMRKKKTNKAWKEEYDKIDVPYICLRRDHYFCFFDVETKKLLSLNRHKIWFSVDSFKDDWLIASGSDTTLPWQYFIELYEGREPAEVSAEVNYDEEKGKNASNEQTNSGYHVKYSGRYDSQSPEKVGLL